MPSESHPSPDRLTRALRALLASHNFRAALLATLTLFASIVLWLALHAVAKWLALLFVTVARNTEAHPPSGIDEVFWLAVACLLALAWIDRRLHPDDRARDHKSPREIAWDFLLAVPRLTLSVWGTLSTWQRLDSREIADAVALIERLSHEPRIRLSSMPLEIPNPARRFKILFALQLLRVIDIAREDRDLWVRLSPLRPRAFQPAPISRPDRPPAYAP